MVRANKCGEHTHTPLTADPAQEKDLLQSYQERVERLSQQDRVKNHKDVFLPAHSQKLYPLEKELGPILNHKIIRPSII